MKTSISRYFGQWGPRAACRVGRGRATERRILRDILSRSMRSEVREDESRSAVPIPAALHSIFRVFPKKIEWRVE